MKNRSLYAVLTRFGIVAAVLTALLVIAPAAAQEADEADDEPCKMNDAGTLLECDYDEIDTVAVAEFTSGDPEGEGIDWSVGGLDGEDFDITGGVLTFKKSPNFEAPSDREREADDQADPPVVAEDDGDNVYLVTITATEMLKEGQKPPAESNSLDVQVTVKDVDEPGMIMLNRLQPQVEVALQATLSDPDQGQDPGNLTALTIASDGWEWTIPKVSRPDPNNDDHWQTGAAGASAGTTVTDSYTPSGGEADGSGTAGDVGNMLRIKVTYTDAHGSGKEVIMLSYHSVRAEPTGTNNAPVFSGTDLPATVTVAEDVPVGRVIGTFAASDANSGDILTYTLTGADAGSFDIDMRTGQVTVGAGLSFETPGPDYEIVINAFDPFGADGTDTHNLTVTTTNVNEAPTVGGGAATGSIPEVDSTPEETDPTYVPYASVAFTASDVDADDQAPDAPTLSLGGDDGSLFDLDEGVVTFKNDPDLEDPKDANQDNKYVVDVIATDDQKLTGKTTLTITVTQVDEDGEVSFSSIQPAIGVAITASVSDPDGSITGATWQWSRAATAAGTFTEIDGATSATYTPRLAEEDNPDTMDVNEGRTTDEGMFLQATVMYRDKASPTEDVDDDDDVAESTAPSATVMGITDNATRARPDVNTAPMFSSDSMTREVNENETTNAGDPVTADDAEDDDISYTITGGADMDKFGITLGTGQITVNSGTKLNFESDQTSYELVVTAMDPFGESDSTTVTLTVTNLNEPPVLDDGELEEDGYPENMTAVTTFTAMDPEGADVTWDVVGTDGAKFDITGGVLTFKDAPNFEMPGDVLREEVLDNADTDDIDESRDAEPAGNNVYELTIMATETEIRPAPEDDTSNKLSSMRMITVTVTDVQEPGMATIEWRQPEATTEIEVEYDDPDNGRDPETPTTDTAVTYQWFVPKVSRPVLDNDDHWQNASGGGNNTDTFTPDGDDVGEFLRVRITYTDAKGADKLFVMSDFEVRTDSGTENQAPTFDATGGFGARNLKEDVAVGALVGAPIAAMDPNSADNGKLTYTLGGNDAASFKIDRATGQLSVGAKLDHEAGGDGNDGIYDVTVTATDPGGEAANQEVDITVGDVNDAPGVSLADSPNDTETLTVDENHVVVDDPETTGTDESTRIGTYVATDVDEGDRTTSPDAVDTSKVKLTLGGDDAGAFKLGDINTDGERALRFAPSPNHESPTDADGNNVYKVSIIATDDDGATGKRDITVTVNNIDEPGKVTLSHIQPAIGRPLMATLSDDDGGENNLMWQWHSAQSLTGTYMPIEDATTDTYTPKAEVPAVEDDPDTPTLDESAPKVPSDEGIYLQVTVTYRDAQSMDDDSGTADVEEGRRGVDTDANDNVDERVLATADNAVRATPADNSDPDFGDEPITRMIDEGAKGRDVPMAVTADDADGDTLTYEVTGGADMASFGIDDDGQITTKIALDFEGDQRTYVIEITATDPFDGSGSTMVTITVTNVNEAPTIGIRPAVNTAPAFAVDATTEFMVDENMDAGAAVGTVTATDEDDDPVTYADDSMYFDVDGDGNITTAMVLDHETMDSHTVTITAEDDRDGTDSIAVTVMVGDVNEAPVFASDTAMISVDENTPVGTEIGPPVAATDEDEGATLEYSLGGDDAASFAIDAATGQLMTVDELDYETKSSYTVTVMVTDGEHSAEITVMVTVDVDNVNEAPVFDEGDSADRNVDENTEAGENIGDPVTATDVDAGDTLTYSLDEMGDMYFDIDSETGQLMTEAALDHETMDSHTVTVTATDAAGLYAMIAVTIMVNDVAETPMFDAETAERSVDENMPAGTAVGDPIAAMHAATYSDDSGYFNVDDMGQITTTMALDYESAASHTVMVTATSDAGEGSIVVTIAVGDVEECEDAGATAVADRTNVGAMADCEALLASRDALMGDDATRMLNWSADTPIAEWYGVRKLSDSGRVEWLYLHGVSSKDATDDDPARAEVKLNGMIPAELGGLTEMTRLYLHRNNLAGGIPAELNGLTNLVWLRLYDNMLSGEVPDLSDMASLERFYVHQNDLTGGVPTALSDSVTHILVHRNMLTGEIPDLSGMTNLVWLGLYDNMLSGEIPATVGGIANLERLYLHGNALTGAVPMEIGNIASLTNLWLENNMLSGDLPSSLDNLTNLERVQISGGDNAFTGCIPAALANAAITDTADTGLLTCAADDGS